MITWGKNTIVWLLLRLNHFGREIHGAAPFILFAPLGPPTNVGAIPMDTQPLVMSCGNYQLLIAYSQFLFVLTIYAIDVAILVPVDSPPHYMLLR